MQVSGVTRSLTDGIPPRCSAQYIDVHRAYLNVIGRDIMKHHIAEPRAHLPWTFLFSSLRGLFNIPVLSHAAKHILSGHPCRRCLQFPLRVYDAMRINTLEACFVVAYHPLQRMSHRLLWLSRGRHAMSRYKDKKV